MLTAFLNGMIIGAIAGGVAATFGWYTAWVRHTPSPSVPSPQGRGDADYRTSGLITPAPDKLEPKPYLNEHGIWCDGRTKEAADKLEPREVAQEEKYEYKPKDPKCLCAAGCPLLDKTCEGYICPTEDHLLNLGPR